MLTEIKARLALPTPAFLKKVQKRTALGSGAFLSLTVLVATITSHVPSFPAIVATAAGYATAMLGGISAACSLAVEDPAQLPASPPTDAS